MPSNRIGKNQELCQVNTAGGVELPIEAFPGWFSLVLQNEAGGCNVRKSLCHVSSHIAAVFLFGLDSNASFEVNSYPL